MNFQITILTSVRVSKSRALVKRRAVRREALDNIEWWNCLVGQKNVDRDRRDRACAVRRRLTPLFPQLERRGWPQREARLAVQPLPSLNSA